MPRIVRKRLDHTTHFAGRFGAIYFITICCQRRGSNQLCHDGTAAALANTARIYHERARWNLNLLLLMPDHLHALIGVDGQTSLAQLIRDYKRITARLQAYDGNGIFSIIAFATMKVWPRSLPTFVRIRSALG